tara:strand:- start:254 stop:970 length:717 start_codon:yes stop_codon:yes gene_type:complete
METIIFFIILVTFLFLLIHNCKEDMKNKKKYKNYRLGDLIKGHFFNSKIKCNKKYLINFPKQFSDTLGARYLEEIKTLPDKEKWNNIEILKNLTNNSKSIIVALHLRLGDIMGEYDKSSNTFKQRIGGSRVYFYQPHFYEKIIKKLKSKGITNVHIFYGSHHEWDKNSDKFLEIIKNLFKKNNIKVIDNSRGNPDEDFIKMSNSKIFIKSGGGFSRLISNLVKKKGGEVIDPADYVNS